jgi:hypothetical protein
MIGAAPMVTRLDGTSLKLGDPSLKPRARGFKLQAASNKRQASGERT